MRGLRGGRWVKSFVAIGIVLLVLKRILFARIIEVSRRNAIGEERAFWTWRHCVNVQWIGQPIFMQRRLGSQREIGCTSNPEHPNGKRRQVAAFQNLPDTWA